MELCFVFYKHNVAFVPRYKGIDELKETWLHDECYFEWKNPVVNYYIFQRMFFGKMVNVGTWKSVLTVSFTYFKHQEGFKRELWTSVSEAHQYLNTTVSSV